MSLYGDNLATSNTNVNFHTVGPSSGVTLNIADNSITINSTGTYTISFSTVILVFESQDDPFSIFLISLLTELLTHQKLFSFQIP